MKIEIPIEITDISGLHLNNKGVSLFNENFVNLLNILDSEN